jgi:hypothetical protein
MFDARIAVEETVADLTDAEIVELNAWHDACDAREDEREERENLYSMISDLSKDVWGFRERFNYREMPIDDLRKACDDWIETHAEYMRNEYDGNWESQILDYVDLDFSSDDVQRDLSVPDEIDDLYREMGW